MWELIVYGLEWITYGVMVLLILLGFTLMIARAFFRPPEIEQDEHELIGDCNGKENEKEQTTRCD